jgi:hypothetical protein
MMSSPCPGFLSDERADRLKKSIGDPAATSPPISKLTIAKPETGEIGIKIAINENGDLASIVSFQKRGPPFNLALSGGAFPKGVSQNRDAKCPVSEHYSMINIRWLTSFRLHDVYRG